MVGSEISFWQKAYFQRLATSCTTAATLILYNKIKGLLFAAGDPKSIWRDTNMKKTTATKSQTRQVLQCSFLFFGCSLLESINLFVTLPLLNKW